MAALFELVALKDLKEEYDRRKQRRLHWLMKDPVEVMKVAELKAEYDRRKPLAWAAARKAITGVVRMAK